MRGDGDGWTQCSQGHQHWGRNGAAGLLLRAHDEAGAVHVLLQHRAPWSHEGGTWGVPGGARDSHETAAETALREAVEEASLAAGRVALRDRLVDDHGGWSYTTVVADADALLSTTPQKESVELRWVAEDEVDTLPLHPGFADSWPQLRARPLRLLVDAANVVGSRPDGWWRDRVGAAERLLRGLARVPGRTVRLPGHGVAYGVVTALTAVLEGQARAARDVEGVEVVRAPGSGDDEVVALAARLVAADVDPAALDARRGVPIPGATVLVVSADRGLRDRLPAQVLATGPRWLRQLTSADEAPPAAGEAR